jgi:hypothetical protein
MERVWKEYGKSMEKAWMLYATFHLFAFVGFFTNQSVKEGYNL